MCSFAGEFFIACAGALLLAKRASTAPACSMVARHALKVAGLPVMPQWHAIRRTDNILLPPAQAMLDFLGKEGSRHLPKCD